MGWNHIVLEGYCSFPTHEQNEQLQCCIKGPGNIGLHCLSYDENGYKKCPYFGYSSARSSVILTGQDGDSIAFNIFSSDENIADEEAWLMTEKNWIEKWKKILKKS